MRFEFKPSFDRSVKQLSPNEKADVKEAASQLIDVLSKDRQIYQGLGLKRLTGNFWEARKGIKVRILFRWTGDLIEFVLAGNHDDVKRFLKNV
jgi:mRNA-degrading endonuclease YafQ of YafQ-DinJ toxin-antitoxin module